MTYRKLSRGQRAQIWIGGPGLPTPELLFETDEMLVEAPNWSVDGASLLVNGDGRLWRLDVDSPERGLAPVGFNGLPEINNDHVLDPDGEHIYMSATDGHIYRGSLHGGALNARTAERVSHEEGQWHFLHGVSPDGSRLAYVQMNDFANPGKLAVMEPHGPSVVVDTGEGHIDGPEWSPDGRWIYFNTEGFTDTPVTCPARPHPRRGRRRRTPCHQPHGRLVPAPVPGRAMGLVHRLSCRHSRAP
ncbi:TolB family protein [Arthrobacter sp. NA-172]|uniref:TolB family protein n=1 Tax=Arthrobacter sp. NA-172 TaxID=3367524 RepID=UPI0037542BBF